MPADNKRFYESGVKVIARISVCAITVSDSPNGVQLIPAFAKPFRHNNGVKILNRDRDRDIKMVSFLGLTGC